MLAYPSWLIAFPLMYSWLFEGCRCCFFVGRIPNMRCGKACCTSIRGENFAVYYPRGKLNKLCLPMVYCWFCLVLILLYSRGKHHSWLFEGWRCCCRQTCCKSPASKHNKTMRCECGMWQHSFACLQSCVASKHNKTMSIILQVAEVHHSSAFLNERLYQMWFYLFVIKEFNLVIIYTWCNGNFY